MSDDTSGAVESVTRKKRKNPAPDSEGKPKKSKVNLANVKNKLRRQELFKNLKHEKNKEKRERRKKQRKDEDWEQVSLLLRGRTQIDSFTRNVQWTFGGEGVKGLDVFKNFVLSTFLPRIFCKKLYSAATRLLYILLM